MRGWGLRRLVGAVGRRVCGTITHVATTEPVAALTFDDGPHPEFTPRLLEILARHDARATFFMVGEAAQRHPELVRQVAQAGHLIGNHGWDHPSFPRISSRERRAQWGLAARALAPYGRSFFRPPFGHQSLASRLDALRCGYDVIAWNMHAFDWLDHPVEWMAKEMLRQLQPGSVILLHDALYHTVEPRYADRRPTLEAVDLLLQQVGERYHFVTVEDLLQRGKPQRENWYRWGDAAWLNRLQSEQGNARRYHQADSRL